MSTPGNELISKIVLGTATEHDFLAITPSARHIVAFLASHSEILKSFGLWCRPGVSKKTCSIGFYNGVTPGYRVARGSATGKGYFRYQVWRVKA